MALGAEGACFPKSSSSTPQWKYHVFLSFRGEDTRKSFTDYLYTTLQTKGIIAFRDDDQLEKGEVISTQLLKAIEESLFAIVVLSQNYASSAWCLDELQKILDSRTMLGREVFPIFYDVDPSDIRYQKGSFGKAFKKHEERYREDQVKKWRDALGEVAGLSGWHTKNRYHSEIIEKIVAELWTKLQAKLPAYNDGLVGIHSKMEDMFSLLDKGKMDVGFIGIWGMGGIGKTTLARVVYEKIRHEFEISCFLENVKEISGDRGRGLVMLQGEFLSHLKIRDMEIRDSYQGKKTIKNLLFNKRVLLVLDDVSDNSQLENLAGNDEWFGGGSRVIITTRDKHLLTSHGVSKTYEIQILDSEQSLQLFCQKAFKEQPEQCYLELSKNVVKYAGGLPLALKVLGSFLCGRSIPEWENALDKMRKTPHKDIISTLQISYEALDDIEKNIFLNIACFFKGMEKGEVTHLLEICDLYPIIGINVLLERCLLTEYCDNKKWYLGMHDMLQEMGKNVVIQESINDAGKRSRLWLQEDIDHVLRKNMGSEFIQGIVLESWSHEALQDRKVLESWSYKALRDPKVLESWSHKALWDPKAFSNMCNLKILILITVDLPLGLDCLSEGLRYLEWRKFPLEELPLDNQLDELVELKMMLSKIKQPWHGIKFFRKLKLIDLSNSEELIRFPSVFGVPYLEQLILEGCIKLEEVDQSVGQHKKLMSLNLKSCVNLKILPSKLEMHSLKDFILSGCSKVKKLPEFGDNMKNLSSLDLKDCRSLVCLPNSIHNAKSLRTLNIIGCSKLSRLPENLDGNEALEELNMSGTAIKEVPPSIILLKGLKKLSIGGHKERESNSWSLSLPSPFMLWRFPVSSCIILPTMSCFSCLEELDLSYCNLSNESLPVGLGCLSSLRKLDLSGNKFVNLPANCIANLSKLYHLGLDCCPRLESVPVLPPHIGSLYGRNCASWKPFSDPLYLCEFFASHKQICSDTYTLREEAPFLFIAGSDIPPWFNNQSYFHLDLPFHYEVFDPFQDTMQPMTLLPTLSTQLLTSITVDIPQYHLSSEWWGIAVCLVLENPFPYVPWSVTPIIYWICKSAEAELPNASAEIYIRKIEEFSDPHLLILLLRGNHRNIQRHLIRGDHSKLQLSFHAHSLLKISKCGGRVLCKEELEAWAKARDERRHFSSLNRSIVREIGNDNQCLDRFEGEYVNASNAEAKRRKLG